MVYVETDKDKVISRALLNPHYSDPQFREEHTVFLKPGHQQNGRNMVEGLEYQYSDRLQEYDYEKHKAAWAVVNEKGLVGSANIIEAFLRIYFEDQDLELVQIITGVNRSDGYPYRVYGFVRPVRTRK